jgi:hypothetical protein
MNKKKGYKMEVIINKDKCIKEANEVDRVAREHF